MAGQATDGIEILDPTVRTAGQVLPAPRLSTLRGKRLGLLDNSKEKADIFLAELAERLTQRFAPAEVIQRRKPSYSRVAPPALIQELGKTCDCVITAMGA
ncbi:MAG TPA: hypothetical protein VNP04_04375 [Alphaproteobacteria bacterium]|nr:hypothetical protein [Alphaproteobacteria bacterium]